MVVAATLTETVAANSVWWDGRFAGLKAAAKTVIKNKSDKPKATLRYKQLSDETQSGHYVIDLIWVSAQGVAAVRRIEGQVSEIRAIELVEEEHVMHVRGVAHIRRVELAVKKRPVHTLRRAVHTP